MAFTEEQRQALKAKLRARHVRTRANNGRPVPFVEGWHAISEANRIFGYDCWDRQTLAPRCLWRETQRGQTACFYSTKVRVTVRAGESVIIREGIGTGVGKSGSAELAHEIALKTAETDATKRALATFGNPFGLALYDKEQKGVTKRSEQSRKSEADAEAKARSFTIADPNGQDMKLGDVDQVVAMVVKLIGSLHSIDQVYAFWEANLDNFASLPRVENGAIDPVQTIGTALKDKVRTFARKSGHQEPQSPHESSVPTPESAELAFPKEKRLRDKAHLAFVAHQPCLVCGRRPAQAHHIRFAQPRALGLKVSDEFTVPLCSGHHDSLHNTGDERAWWARHGILDPLKLAARLWVASHQPGADANSESAAATTGAPTVSPEGTNDLPF